MQKLINRLILFLLLITLLKGLVWSFFVPLWHFPDEQAHFAHIAYLAEGGKPPIGRGLDLSEEILTSEHILRTKRDGWGNNSFTYHPEFNIDYSNSMIGLRENEINNLPKETRSNFIKTEAATYGNYFYQISGWVYKIFYTQNLFIRVFTIRIFWLFCIVGIIWMTFLITKAIFPKNLALQLTVPILVSFQPMLTFVSSGVTIDNLFNLLFTIIIYLSLLLIIKPKILNITLLLIFVFLLLMTKNNSFIAFIIIIPPVVYAFLKEIKLFIKVIPIFLIIFAIILITVPYVKDLITIFFSGQIPYLDFKTLPALKNYSIWDHFIWSVKHTIGEVLPWYWGVFRWLSLTLPKWTNRILMRMILVAAIGLVLKIILIIKKKQYNQQTFLLGFICYVATVYFLALFIWDWFFYRGNNYSFGFQGRYYFPVIVCHMILLAVGVESIGELINSLVKKNILKRINFRKWFLWLLSIWFLVLNWIAFFWLTSSYYDLSSFQKFIIQASQYKPWFAKGYWLVGILTIYFISWLMFVSQFFKLLKSKK